MSIEGQGHFFTIYFPGFVCFVLYLDKISGEKSVGRSVLRFFSVDYTHLKQYNSSEGNFLCKMCK